MATTTVISHPSRLAEAGSHLRMTPRTPQKKARIKRALELSAVQLILEAIRPVLL